MDTSTTAAPEPAARRHPAVWAALLFAALLLKVVLARALLLGSPLSAQGLLRDACFLAVVAGPALAFSRYRAARIALLGLSLVLSVAMFATVVYARYFGEVASLKVLGLAGQVGDVGGSVAELLSPIDLLFFADLVLLAVGLLRRRDDAAPCRPRLMALLAVGWILCGVFVAQGVVSVTGMPGMLNSIGVSRARGVFAYQIATLFHEERLADDIEVDPELPGSVIATIADLKGSAPATRTTDVPRGVAAGSNVLLVQLEAFQGALIGATLDGVEITPNLNALVSESWYFPHAYTQIGGGNTSDAEWVSNTSLYPATTDVASMRWQDRLVPSLPRTLRSNGYTAVTFHANDASFWNRRNLYAALGFDRYYDADYFGDHDAIVWGSSDEYVYEQSLQELLDLREGGEPFYAQIVSVSAHHPFKPIPERKDPLAIPVRYGDSIVGRYIQNQAYADRALGQLIDELKATGLWDETLVVVYGDHYGLRRPAGEDVPLYEELFGRSYNVVDFLNVPLVVHLPGQEAGVESSAAAGLIDIMPTVLDALGVEAEGAPMFGRSLFAGGPVYVGMRKYATIGSYVTEGALIAPGDAPGTGIAIPLDDPTGRHAPTQDELAGLDVVAQLMLLSDAYADALPVRPDFRPDEKADIPTMRDE